MGIHSPWYYFTPKQSTHVKYVYVSLPAHIGACKNMHADSCFYM